MLNYVCLKRLKIALRNTKITQDSEITWQIRILSNLIAFVHGYPLWYNLITIIFDLLKVIKKPRKRPFLPK